VVELTIYNMLFPMTNSTKRKLRELKLYRLSRALLVLDKDTILSFTRNRIREFLFKRPFTPMSVKTDKFMKVKKKAESIISYALANIVVATFTERAKTVYSDNIFSYYTFLLQSQRKTKIGVVANDMNIRTYLLNGSFFIYFTDYLRSTSGLGREYSFSIQNLDNGYVIIREKKRMATIVANRIRLQLKTILSREPEKIDIIKQLSSEFMADVLTEFPERRTVVRRALGKNIPPCIAIIMDKATKGVHLEHQERIALATFLIRKGYSDEDIHEFFKKQDDYKRRTTQYHIDWLRRNNYMVYGCKKMKTLGMCFPDQRCVAKNLKNPLQY